MNYSIYPLVYKLASYQVWCGQYKYLKTMHSFRFILQLDQYNWNSKNSYSIYNFLYILPVKLKHLLYILFFSQFDN